METVCVRVERSAGERTRRELAAADLVADDVEIVAEDGDVFIPVSDPSAVPEEFDLVRRDLPERSDQTMPADLLSFEPSYERIGDVVVVDEDDRERAEALADAIVESDLPVETVLNRASEVKGTERVRDWDLLAGEGTETVHREYGTELLVDLASVYFSPRLATERHRVVEQVDPGETVVDMFAGVGPFAVPMAEAGATVVAVDVNESAIEYLRENADRNGVGDRITAIDADVREVAAEYADRADRIVMNLPHSADEFLDAAVTMAGDRAFVHYYDIQHEDDPFGPGEAAIRAAAETEYDVTVENQRHVRSYAPHELNVVLDVILERRE